MIIDREGIVLRVKCNGGFRILIPGTIVPYREKSGNLNIVLNIRGKSENVCFRTNKTADKQNVMNLHIVMKC